MSLLLENTLPAERMAGCAFAEPFRNAAEVAANGGTVYGTPTINNSLVVTGVGNYVRYPSVKINLEFTLLFKFKLNNNASSSMIIRDNFGSPTINVYFHFDTQRIRFNFYDGSVFQNVYSTNTITVGRWYNIAIMRYTVGGVNYGIIHIDTINGVQSNFGSSYKDSPANVFIGFDGSVLYGQFEIKNIKHFKSKLDDSTILAYLNNTMWNYDHNCVLWMDGKLKHYSPSFTGPELITNGNFQSWSGDNPVDWVIPPEDASNYITQVGFAARCVSNGTNIYIQKSALLTIGKTYAYSIKITAAVAGSIKLASSITAYATLSAVGTYTGTFVADSVNIAVGRLSTPTDITFTDVSIKEVIPSHVDVSGKGNHMKFGDQVTTTTFPTKLTTKGGGYYFDGGDYLKTILPSNIGNEFTISIRQKTVLDSTRPLFAFYDENKKYFLVLPTTTSIIYGQNNKYSVRSAAAFPIPWSHISKTNDWSFVFNKSADSLKCFLNGVLYETFIGGTLEAIIGSSVENNVYIGYTALGSFGKMTCEKFSFHNAALNQIQIYDLQTRMIEDQEV